MDGRSLALLEFPLVRARLAELTSFPPSRRLAEQLEPESDPVLVTRALDETDQARALLQERPGVGVGASHDIGPAVERANPGDRAPVPVWTPRVGIAYAGEPWTEHRWRLIDASSPSVSVQDRRRRPNPAP